MTMRLTIKNDDPSRTAIVETIDFNPESGVEGTPSVGSIAPGDTQEVWIHSGRKVVLKEKQEG